MKTRKKIFLKELKTLSKQLDNGELRDMIKVKCSAIALFYIPLHRSDIAVG